ncbi:MAG: hypothetical protein VCC00_13120, partial [Deltaproteobacteria bacterium]
SVQSNHMHLLVEAENADCLSRGMQGLSVRLARGLNRVFGRRGRLFPDRFHHRVLKTPREMRNALAYVLLNARKHGERAVRRWLDPHSTAAFFDGWIGPVNRPHTAATPPRRHAATPPRSWLMRLGWRRRGLIPPDMVPSG